MNFLLLLAAQFVLLCTSKKLSRAARLGIVNVELWSGDEVPGLEFGKGSRNGFSSYANAFANFLVR